MIDSYPFNMSIPSSTLNSHSLSGGTPSNFLSRESGCKTGLAFLLFEDASSAAIRICNYFSDRNGQQTKQQGIILLQRTDPFVTNTIWIKSVLHTYPNFQSAAQADFFFLESIYLYDEKLQVGKKQFMCGPGRAGPVLSVNNGTRRCC